MRGRIRILFLILADVLCVYGVWALMVWGYWAVGLGSYEPSFYVRMWPVGLAWIALNAVFKLYHGNLFYPAAPLSPVEEFRRLVDSALVTHIGVIAFLAFSRQTTQDYSRFVIAASGLLVAILAQPLRDLVRRMLFQLNIGQIPAVLMGSGKAAVHVMRVLEGNAYYGIRLVGYFDREGRTLGALPRLGEVRQIVDEARRRGIRLLIACEDERIVRCQLREFTEWFTHIEFVPSTAVFPVFGSQVISLDGVGGIEMVNQGRMRMLRLEKWMVDKALATLVFAVLSPFFVVIPLLIKLTSKGPVFYRQNRLGQQGRPIRVWKFRSMYADADARLARILAEDPKLAAEWQTNHKLAHDPRVTPFGKLLRKTSLDEIPQLFNVFEGTMALVGPRPIVREEVAFYGESYDIFASERPGITGLWQVSGRSETDYERRVALDTQYILNWSPWMDFWIVVRTVYAVVFMRGAC